MTADRRSELAMIAICALMIATLITQGFVS
jgi:hypothetical protein